MDTQKYAAWITEIRGEMTQKDFGQHIVHYRMRGERLCCLPYHRNEVENWEYGKNLPMTAEAFLSLALFEYDKTHPFPTENIARNQRYLYVWNRMREFLEYELYPRNLHDALLISVCRGLLSFEEVPEAEQRFSEQLSAVPLKKAELDAAAMQRKTLLIRKSLYQTESMEELQDVILRNSVFYLTADATFGKRFMELYSSRNRLTSISGSPVSFPLAVSVLAPRYTNTYKRVNKSSRGITREWILDLCRHLRFSKEELDQVLTDLYMLPLAAEETAPSFAAFSEMPLPERYMILYAICRYVQEENYEALLPVEYILESFTLYAQAEKLSEAFGTEGFSHNPPQAAVMQIEDWIGSLQPFIVSAGARALLEAYKNEHAAYFLDDPSPNAPKKKYYMCALFYTVLTGKGWKGENLQLWQRELIRLGDALKAYGKQGEKVYNFTVALLCGYLADGNQQCSMEDIAKLLLDAIRDLTEQKQ